MLYTKCDSRSFSTLFSFLFPLFILTDIFISTFSFSPYLTLFCFVLLCDFSSLSFSFHQLFFFYFCPTSVFLFYLLISFHFRFFSLIDVFTSKIFFFLLFQSFTINSTKQFIKISFVSSSMRNDLNISRSQLCPSEKNKT